MSAWQPIETAPKDGTRVLLATKYGVEIAAWSNTYWVNFGRGAWVVNHNRSETEEAEEPTHWMPFPDPPVSP